MKMSSKFTCRFCKEQFDVPKGLYKHLQVAHNAGSSRDNRTCPICGVLCAKYEGYRDHLLYIHGQTDDGLNLTFKSLNEFLVWKTELEIKHNCKYVLQSAPKVLPTKEKKYFYQCDRSDSKSKDKKDKRSVSVVMKTCSSVISVVEGTGIFKVEYWDTHSGHSDASTPLTQNELEAAISSVEMVNAIADSDDSFDRSAAFVIPDNTSSPISIVEKPTVLAKTNSPSSMNSFNNSSISNTVQKTKITQLSGKIDGAKKKSTNTSILYSLASVACGKGIAKKSNKLKSSKNVEAQNIVNTDLQVNSKSISETSDKNSEITSLKDDNVPVLSTTVSAVTPSVVESTATSTLPPVTTKATSSGPLAIAPKITTVTSNTINSLFTTNSAFPNQLVIVNPMNLDQNAINSGQNVLTAGQNILFSLAPIGQNILPNSTTSQTISQIPVLADKSSVTSGSMALNKIDSSVKVTASNASTAVNLLTGSQSVSNSIASSLSSTTVSTAPITLTTGINNAPVILSSLPVGSTFMSVNNNLIPIASPSGAFIPTSLPPNIVLTPVVSGTTLSNKDSSNKSTVSSAGIVPSTHQSHQAQMRFTTPSTIAITVSSIVKEPVYTSSAVRHMSNIVTSSTSPVTSTSTNKNSKISNKAQNKFIPITIAGSVSPLANVNKSVSNRTALNANRSPSNSTVNKPAPNSVTNKSDSVSKNASVSASKFMSNASASKVASVSNKSTFDSSSLSVNVSPVSNPRNTPSARKRVSRSFMQSKQSTSSITLNTPSTNITVSAPTITTKVVNSHLNLAPISSTPNVTMTTSQQLNKPGTFLFESSGEIYMLEPVENDTVENLTPLKSITSSDIPKIKIERSVQTCETSNAAALKSKLQRKRAAPPTDDSAVMLKVKCYQLEMKYLSSQTECKRLKVELTKERLKNAELTGATPNLNLEEDRLTETTRSKALEIMKEIEDKYSGSKNVHIYTMTKTSVLRSLYEDLEELCFENGELHKELENYRAHDKFYKSLKKRLYDEDF